MLWPMGLNPIQTRVNEVNKPLENPPCRGHKMRKQSTGPYSPDRGGLVPRCGEQSDWLNRVKMLLAQNQRLKNLYLLFLNDLMDKVSNFIY